MLGGGGWQNVNNVNIPQTYIFLSLVGAVALTMPRYILQNFTFFNRGGEGKWMG